MKKKEAYIFDVDGTLAFKGDRDIFDYSKVILDTCNEPVAQIFKILGGRGYTMIVCSGREDDSFKMTSDWLYKHQLFFDHLFMRKKGDHRQDAIIKREIYESEIKEKYKVLGVFDDRDQVVKLWRELGLTCFQVAYGDF